MGEIVFVQPASWHNFILMMMSCIKHDMTYDVKDKYKTFGNNKSNNLYGLVTNASKLN
jgi:hypothetical protein